VSRKSPNGLPSWCENAKAAQTMLATGRSGPTMREVARLPEQQQRGGEHEQDERDVQREFAVHRQRKFLKELPVLRVEVLIRKPDRKAERGEHLTKGHQQQPPADTSRPPRRRRSQQRDFAAQPSLDATHSTPLCPDAREQNRNNRERSSTENSAA
jgi:hypothetical protein